jgi:3-hydroxyisobutyrate dehydrogenase
MIAFFGTGLLGSGFVRALRRRGEDVRVWNRTIDKARPLAEVGARVFDDPAEAARGAERVHLSLSDDAAVDEVLARAKPTGVIVDHTTTSATGTAARAQRWEKFLHAPVFMGPQNALESTGIMLASGPRARFDALEPALAAMTGRLIYLGPDPGRAAAFKLMGNLFLMHMTTGVAEMLALAKALGVPAAEAQTMFDVFNPAPSLGARAKRMLDGNYAQPSWELAMARKDARLMLEEAGRAHQPLDVLAAIAAVMDRYIARGHGHDDWTVIAKDGLPS